MTPIAEEKAMLREQGLAERRSLSVRERREKSVQIRDHLKQLAAFERASLVLTYVGVKDGEVETLPLIATLTHEGRRVAVPSIVARGFMIWRQISGIEQFSGSRFGIPEPRRECPEIKKTTPSAVILVPGILYSPSGYRIGYGGGYFDRFLKDFPGTSVGVAFQMQVTDKLPVEPHDIPVDYLVTEMEILDCATLRQGSRFDT
ncbi:MAG: 5-formyltetrahydrofolate cyclo-ligase [Bryobacteraceae bacterium]|nr:5-formyltetrahydrofolate cyclo-ligase [Bryobacteraceae bacterium]